MIFRKKWVLWLEFFQSDRDSKIVKSWISNNWSEEIWYDKNYFKCFYSKLWTVYQQHDGDVKTNDRYLEWKILITLNTEELFMWRVDEMKNIDYTSISIKRRFPMK